MTRSILLLLFGGCLLVQGCAGASQAVPAPRAKISTGNSPCRASDLRLSFDGRDGEFTGMSHDGALLTLKNQGSAPCTVPRRPRLTFTDAGGRLLPLHPHVPPGMHPGPVMVPVLVAPGDTVQGRMRWVAGPVYDTNTCTDTAQAAMTAPGGDLRAPFRAHVCGPSPASLEYEQEFMLPAGAVASPGATH